MMMSAALLSAVLAWGAVADQDGFIEPEAVRATFALSVLCESLAQAARSREEFDQAISGVVVAAARRPRPLGGDTTLTLTGSACRILYRGPNASDVERGLVGEHGDEAARGRCSQEKLPDHTFRYVCKATGSTYRTTIRRLPMAQDLSVEVSPTIFSPDATGIDCRGITGSRCPASSQPGGGR